MMDRIINRLHRVFNKDPKPIAVLTLSGNAVLTIDSESVTIASGTSVTRVSKADKTILQLATEITATTPITATPISSEYSPLLAKGILASAQQEISADNKLYMPSSVFFAEMLTYAWVLEQQSSRINDAEKQLYLHATDEDWLDVWGEDYFGIGRGGVTDEEYRGLVISSISAGSCNNTAMANAIRALSGVSDAAIVDATAAVTKTYNGALLYDAAATYSGLEQPAQFECNITLAETTTPLLTILQHARSVINKRRAAGTKLKSFLMKQELTDQAGISDVQATAAHAIASDVLPWGARYDGSLHYDNADARLFNGTLTYNGIAVWNGQVATRTLYNNVWENGTQAVHITAIDRQTTHLFYDGLADFDGFENFSATDSPIRDGRIKLSVKKHYLYDGKRTYGGNKVFTGALRYDGSTGYAVDMLYQGIHTIQEIQI
jgi:hypothetical protein